MYLMSTCNTFSPQIKGSFSSLNVMYHNLSSPGVLQLPWCATVWLTIRIAFSIDYSITRGSCPESNMTENQFVS